MKFASMFFTASASDESRLSTRNVLVLLEKILYNVLIV